MAEGEGGPEVGSESIEPGPSSERAPVGSTEQESKEPTLEEQAGIYAEMFGVDKATILEALCPRARSIFVGGKR